MSLFDLSDRARQYQSDLLEFMDSHVYPAEAVYEEQMRESGDPHFQPPVLEELKARGHDAARVAPFSIASCATAALIDPATGNRIAGADPRRDCYAAAY